MLNRVFFLEPEAQPLDSLPTTEPQPPLPTPDCLACPQVFAQHNFLWLAVFSLMEKPEVPARAELTMLGEELALVLGSAPFSLYPAFPSVHKQPVNTPRRVHTHRKGVNNAS